MSSFFFIRHGYTGIPVTKQESDHSLNAIGRKQVNLLADRLKEYEIHQLVSSPFTRAKESAEIIAEKISGEELSIDDRLKEIVVWSDPYEMLRDDDEIYKKTIQEMTRFKSVFSDLLSDYATSEHCNTCFVTHGNLIRAFVMTAFQLPDYSITKMRVSHASISVITKIDNDEGDYFVLDRFNDTAHLEDMRV